MGERCTYEKQYMWDVISTCSTWVYEPIKQVWVYVVLCMIRITIPGCVILLDLARVKIEYFLEKVQLMKSIGPQPDQEVGRDWRQLQINEVAKIRAA